MNVKSILNTCSIAALFLAAACAHNSSLSVSRDNLGVSTKSFNGKNVVVDLEDQRDVLNSSMGGNNYSFDNAKNTVRALIATSLKDSAKSVNDGKKGDIVLRPDLKLNIVNDYFTLGCLAKVQIEVLNSKGVVEKTISKDFKRTFVTGWGYKSACNEASTEVMALALQSI